MQAELAGELLAEAGLEFVGRCLHHYASSPASAATSGPPLLTEHVAGAAAFTQLIDLPALLELLDHGGEGIGLHADQIGNLRLGQAIGRCGGEGQQHLAGGFRIHHSSAATGTPWRGTATGAGAAAGTGAGWGHWRWCSQEPLQGTLHRGIAVLGDEGLQIRFGELPRQPVAVVGFLPEPLFQAMGDRQAAIGGALGNHPLGPEMEGEMGPVVIALHQLVPALLALLLPGGVGRDAPEDGVVDDHAIVEVGIPERGDEIKLALEDS